MSTDTNQIRDGRGDFDFFMGRWNSQHRRLKERLTGCQEWEAFEGITDARHILGGMGNIDEITMARADGPGLGLTLRLYDPETGLWRIHWASSGNNDGFGLPMVGQFYDNRGEFYAQEMFGKQSVFVRFIWSVFDENACRWEQAFSNDGGKTWETNWTTDFTRLPA